jgi:lysylphosphatidylglycerol synthetase-like protein (DUF2156 family)
MNAAKKFKNEGFKEINMGLSPLHERKDNKFVYSKSTKKIADFLYQNLNWAYSFKDLGENKDRYKADKSQVYFATKKQFPFLEVFGLLKLNHIF